MPSYLGFNSTKEFRDNLIARTINATNGPQTFTETNYEIRNLNVLPNVDLPDVDHNREQDLAAIRKKNIFKPEDYYIFENLSTAIIERDLATYPYFNPKKYNNLVGIMDADDFSKESELIKFASKHIKDDRNGPFYSRVEQTHNLQTAKNFSAVELLNTRPSTIGAILKGEQGLIPLNYKITPNDSTFLEVVSGKKLPWSDIPGDYLTNPNNPRQLRPKKGTELGNIWQDVTGSFGELFGIERRESQDRKPSDLFVEYLGQGQKQILFRNLSYSKYGPNYTASARSNNSSRLFGFVSDVLNGNENFDDDAPDNVSYIGDDRSNSVKYAMSDYNGNSVRGSYYMTMMFDEELMKLHDRTRPIADGGGIGSSLTWLSVRSKNRLGLYNGSYGSQSSQLEESKSTNYDFREGSIMAITQDLLNTLPKDGLSSRSHVANVIDQTSRFFRNGNKNISRGSAVVYVNRDGQDVGAEYCRVWTKDRPYFTYGDTMKRTGNIRNFDASVLGGGGKPWNLNIAPMSNGNKSFDNSTNIVKNPNGDGFIAKKYMFSIENLAWKDSQIRNFTVNDLPYAERGPNGGRVMWFPPYNLKVNENNTATWNANKFLGRPEPIYTYANSERTGTLTFSVVVDHPSILNLLVREHFKDMTDNEADQFINAFFSGCEDIDFYDLIRRYTTLDPNDVELITQYLNEGGDPEVVTKMKSSVIPVEKPIIDTPPVENKKTFTTLSLLYPNDFPKKGGSEVSSASSYSDVYNFSLGSPNYAENTKNGFLNGVDEILSRITPRNKQDTKVLFKQETVSENERREKTTELTATLDHFIRSGISGYRELFVSEEGRMSVIDTIKEDIEKGVVQEIRFSIVSSCSAIADDNYNYKLSARRTHSVLKDILRGLKGDYGFNDKWTDIPLKPTNHILDVTKEYNFKELGFEKEGKIIITTKSLGEKIVVNDLPECTTNNFNNINLRKYSPPAFGCRQSHIKVDYIKAVLPETDPNLNQNNDDNDGLNPMTRLDYVGEDVSTANNRRPNIDVMKRIIMKTLSEGYYFKKLEETDPMVFSSLRDKLKYFHPGFHSTTPEGLNSRLTFLNQCIRPGDTVPVKGINEESDLVARNTTFGAPPICILRVGDFYHSKIAIDTLHITYEDGSWDLNPEGIGMQPMLANVTMNFKFIGGQGLEKPVERLQNALSSNFYANTEMYDERSITTNSTINGNKYETFTKKFLTELNEDHESKVSTVVSNNGKGGKVVNDKHIGTGHNELSYSQLITTLADDIRNYFVGYESAYNVFTKKYGKHLADLYLSNKYANIIDYIIDGDPITLIGVNSRETNRKKILDNLTQNMVAMTESADLSQIIGYKNQFPTAKRELIDGTLKNVFKERIKEITYELETDVIIANFEKLRNELIITLDKINFLFKYGHDCTVKDGVYYKTNLEGFNDVELRKNLRPLIRLITNNQNKIQSHVDQRIFLDNLSHVQSSFNYLLSVFLKETTTFDHVDFTPQEKQKINDKIAKFRYTEKDHIFRFNLKTENNEKEIKFKVVDDEEITDDELKSEVTLIFSDRLNNKTQHLNYYRKNV